MIYHVSLWTILVGGDTTFNCVCVYILSDVVHFSINLLLFFEFEAAKMINLAFMLSLSHLLGMTLIMICSITSHNVDSSRFRDGVMDYIQRSSKFLKSIACAKINLFIHPKWMGK